MERKPGGINELIAQKVSLTEELEELGELMKGKSKQENDERE